MTSADQSNLKTSAHRPAGVRVETVRIAGFRGIHELCLTLEPEITLFLGENNTGKSSVLEALAAVLGGQQTTEDDLYLAVDGTRVHEFVVDLTLLPSTGPSFDPDTAAVIATAVQRSDGQEFAAIRTVGEPAEDRSGLSLRRSFLGGWSNCHEDSAAAYEMPQPPVTRQVLDTIAFSLLGANRDLVSEIRSRRTPWGRIVASVEIDADVQEAIEAALADLGAQIVDGSEVLARLRDDLARVRRALGTSVSEVTLAALPARLDELSRAIDVLVTAPGGAPIPMRLQGLGSRSLAALMVFQAFVEMRRGAGRTIPPHSLTAFEEPEAHLHPQAQRAVTRLVEAMPGQKVMSTHSPQVVSVGDIHSFRVFSRRAGAISVSSVRSRLTGEELAEIQKRVLRPHPEVFFAKVVFILEGSSEEAAVPVFARTYWEEDPPEGLGVTFVNAQSIGQAGVLVRVLEDLGITWLILVDGDQAGQDDLRGIGKRLGRSLNESSSEVVMLPAGQNFEAYLLSEGLRPAIEVGVANCFGPDALNAYKSRRQGQRDYMSAGWEDRLISDFLHDHKGTYGVAVAEAITAQTDPQGDPMIPSRIRELLDRVSAILKGP